MGWYLGLSLLPGLASAVRDARIDYDRDVRPLLSQNCYPCHGPDATHREAGLRLDRKESALGRLDSGDWAIVPGDLTKSRLARITAADRGERMPPPESGKSLKPEQVEVLTKWIQQASRGRSTGRWSGRNGRRFRP